MEYYWHLVGRGRDCSWTSCKARGFRRILSFKIAILPRLRKPFSWIVNYSLALNLNFEEVISPRVCVIINLSGKLSPCVVYSSYQPERDSSNPYLNACHSGLDSWEDELAEGRHTGHLLSPESKEPNFKQTELISTKGKPHFPKRLDCGWN